MSTGVAVAYTGALVAFLFAPMVVTVLKRQWLLFAAGWMTIGTVWLIAAFRLGRPDSWWASRFYGDKKMARAGERYPVS